MSAEQSGRFPVVDERPLLRPERRWFFGAWRDPAQLPVRPPGCIYLFAVGGKYIECPNSGHLQGTEPELVNATWVSLVNTRHRRITATAWVPSTDPASDFAVRVVFGCIVAQSDVVAMLGLTDLQRELNVRVGLDENLVSLQHQFAIEQIDKMRAEVTSRLSDSYRERPPAVQGMQIVFEGVHVHTPRELQKHHAELRDAKWSREEEELREAHELRRVEHAEKLLLSPERAEAAAIARQEKSTGEAAERGFKERDIRTQRLIEQVKAWIEADGAKRAPIDRRWLAEELFRTLTDEPPPQPDLAELAHTNGHSDPAQDGPVIPLPDRIDGI